MLSLRKNHATTRKQVGITLVGNIFTQDTCRGGIHSVPHTANLCRGGIYSVPNTANPCRSGIYSVPHTANPCRGEIYSVPHTANPHRGGRFCPFRTSLKRNNNAVSLSKKPTALLYKRIGAIVLTPYYSLEKPHLV